MALLATVVAATGRSVTTLSGVGFMAFRALWDYDCLFSFILFSRRPTPFHTPIVCSVLSPLGVSTSSSILSPLAGFFSVEVLLPKVVLVIPAKTSRTGLKMSLLLILIVSNISTDRAVSCPSLPWFLAYPIRRCEGLSVLHQRRNQVLPYRYPLV